MRKLAPLALGLMLSLAVAAPSFARPMEGAEARRMQTSVDVYLGAIGRGEADRVVAALPPRIKNIFAGSAGIEAGKLDGVLIEQTAALLKAAKFDDLAADYTAVDATDSVLADGTRVTWTVVPTQFSVETDAGKVLNRQPLLVLNEAGKWYMMRIEGAQQQELVSIAYPFLKDVSFPAASTAPMQ
ncbi:hypothetical protein GVY41_17985 [Frigidibacter albus]|uniref:DUF3828 domain-containing protein n=1 Tax=Frigidibacter albus TaxID=1465486 RepID=A0A6L8VPD0_9RHOB|nr:hypothetical protein [Frigidibacter albus]MZQ91010.1 hypothetical protein [Frigidibacter albus]NBE32895.1 hypothetical protein [Frigidibacter albus]GGH62274.1 hypothetical protein GCM10011341_36310 [Frigidibacter albus]